MVELCEKIDLADLKKHRATLEEREAVVLKSARSALITLRHPGLRLRYWARHPDGREPYLDEVVPFVYTPTLKEQEGTFWRARGQLQAVIEKARGSRGQR